VLEALQNSDFSNWLLVSTWGYAIILTLHSLGLAMVVGLLVVIDLRVLGIARSIPLLPLKKLMLLVWLAFAVNAATGTALFVADATKFFYSRTFQLKLLSIVIGLTLAALLSSSVLNIAAQFDRGDKDIPAGAKLTAAASLLLWVAAIGLGRYMAYE
jgi:hypothetical protein